MRRKSLLERLAENVEHRDCGFETECWVWTAHTDGDGYARANMLGRLVAVHRATYEHFVGPIPEGLTLDHLCRIRRCVNPEHLEPVTVAVNVARGAPAQKTECVHGHPFDEGNTYIAPNGRRACRRCTAQRARRYQARLRAKAGAA